MSSNESSIASEDCRSAAADVVCLFLGNSKIVTRRGQNCGKLKAFASGPEAAREASSRLEELGRTEKLVEIEPGLFFAALDEMELPEALEQEGWFAVPLRDFYEESKLPKEALSRVRANAIRIPYLYLNTNEYIYRFRAEKERNRKIYQVDDSSVALYHSALCDAIKAVKRAKERSATTPAFLDFGATEFLLPSHFGFCLGVQNAIERAYETLAANPGKRVFMLSELIHNPFVNQDLQSRGLKYLQSDKGVPQLEAETGRPYWDSLSDQDIVIIPAFGARDEDKLRLIERGLPIRQYDATCMLVEKVWKAARRYGQQGYTIVIHGKAEHEETKATFSNSAKYAPSVVIRDMKEAAMLGDVIRAETEAEKRRLFEPFLSRSSVGFDPSKDLDRLALVNQTTLLRNETLKIIAYLEETLTSTYGEAHITDHLAMSSKGDTLCYATQVNQDALAKALDEDIDAAIVVGGKNSSNTFQLFRLCQERFGDRAFYIQSEANILSRSEVEHFIFPYDPKDPKQGVMEKRAFLPENERIRVLVTGGASCPDGILQQIICRINSFFPPERIRSIESVLADFE
ncbi:4-hydroxy-3-methylbut-2-enyl diphosphate reductase [Pelagicoccus sp. SDUM812005]|uniref:4-hydroxy-3-methylbut-2-enyl diphosphate reductase n=1 Tax=Pelagicoccus sp. SDUM812005 TaxID=3041257 RepID=UPI00280FD9AC|nr:4-hydroxy-3-methylbut-2-enyl diphosphate reductase [Pelagicoccus sp. SDUM812005]MDQ8181379.1 4-hydroxy-3-methylbut-2-enyl diphosphate reductase [Pelagicoccus sp. SDUM812005]